MGLATSNIRPSDIATVLAVIDPDANAAGAISTGWIDMGKYPSLLGILLVGDFVATGLADFKAQQASDSSGTGVKDVTGKAITQLTAAGTDDNKQAVINLSIEDLDLANSFDHARFTFTLTTAGADSGAIVLGFDDRHGDGNHVSTVDEVV